MEKTNVKKKIEKIEKWFCICVFSTTVEFSSGNVLRPYLLVCADITERRTTFELHNRWRELRKHDFDYKKRYFAEKLM